MDNTQVAVAYRTTDEMVADTNEIRTTLRSRHEAIVDLLISAPHLKIREIAERVGLSQSYISTLINSDTFRTRLAERREQLIDPLIVTSFEDRMRGAMAQSLEVLTDELEKKQTADLALRILEVGGRGAAYGARPAGPAAGGVTINLPGSATSPQVWLENAGGNKSAP